VRIDNEFTVSASIDRAWEVLTDLEGIAPCLPGAQLTGRDGDVYTGTVTVKVGPVTTAYAGTASFVEQDEVTHHAVIDAKGRDSRGAGNAAAVITADLSPASGNPSQTTVTVSTDLKISGKIAQFGSGMIQEVSRKLLGEFVDCLEAKLAAQAPVVPAEAAVVTAAPAAIDMLAVSRGAVAKRAAPVAVAVVVVAAVIVYVVRR
jgi:carbon monoxide dehydrogenase subunit G